MHIIQCSRISALLIICAAILSVTMATTITGENDETCSCSELLLQCFEAIEVNESRVKDCSRAYRQCQLACKQSHNYDGRILSSRVLVPLEDGVEI